jgi:DtxR family Mn-dependent transcriptional regulator
MAGRRVHPSSHRTARGVTAVVEDYLKVIWNAQEWSSDPITTSMLAERIGVGAPTVSETVGRLVSQGWVEHEPYGAVTLTDGGRRLAVTMVRRHRLIETWLVEQMGFGWDEVHDEAEVLEHAVSERFVDALDERLGHPARDPHGDPIPRPDGTVVRPAAVPLVTLAPGERGLVARIDDADPDVLRQCAARGVVLDAELTAPTALPDEVRAAVLVVRMGR